MVKRKEGDVVVAQNGYSYTYVVGAHNTLQRFATHHLIALDKYGRPPREDERVIFKDNNRRNLDPDNIEYATKTTGTLQRRKATLEDRIRELKAELAEVNEALGGS